MSHTPHELSEEFPHAVEAIHRLKQEDAHFARLFDAYHEVNRAIHRAETKVEPVSDSHETELRRKRMLLKDEIAQILGASV
ncbi:MAG: YdcH family protein [Roseinatronobacter sp.]